MSHDDSSEKPPRHKSRRRFRRRRKRDVSYEKLVRHFMACGRCGYFLAGYRVLFGNEVLHEAADESEGGWIFLDWDPQTRHLLHKSYGVRTDVDLVHLEHRCEECRRRFVYEEFDEEPADYFRMEIKLR